MDFSLIVLCCSLCFSSKCVVQPSINQIEEVKGEDLSCVPLHLTLVIISGGDGGHLNFRRHIWLIQLEGGGGFCYRHLMGRGLECC